MQRHTLQKDKRICSDSLLNDKELLLLKLCDQILISGFVFEDSTENEIEIGDGIIRNYFDQENKGLYELVSNKSLNEFLKYLSRFEWPYEILKKKLCHRIKKSFDQLAKGKHHHYNILYNITQGLRQPKGHPLTDFLLYIEAYYILVLDGTNIYRKNDDEQSFKKKHYVIDDLINFRKEIRERLEGRILVKSFLRHIAKLSGESAEKFIKTEEKSYDPFLLDDMIEPKEVDQKILKEEFKDLKNYNANISINYNEKFENEDVNEFDLDEPFSVKQSGSDDSDVVFGNDIIIVSAMEKFVLQYPESALKFLMRQNIDGKPLSSEIRLVHAGWEKRGLSRNMLKNYVLKLMNWSDFPDLPFQDIYLQIRNRIFEVSRF
tara:strand:+ start:5747 stop:6874 length:1128 start_codon:yes stop_codon:yes gene_type:complete